MHSVIVVAGPTASGKSALALALAERHRGAVINADSMQVYRELSVLTARPGADSLARAPHFLYGTIPAAERCSAGRWRDLALAAIAECREAGRLPVVVGGTGLYLKALMAGIVPVPEIPDSIRRAVRERIAAAGVEAVHAELARRDPASAAAIGTRDVQRIARALEVVEATGRPLSDWRADGWQGAGEGMRFFVVLLAPPRDALYRACDTRFARMIERGGIDEVRALAALGLDPALPAMKALGVREILRHLAGELTLDQARAAGAQATRNYVKRQATWFRHQLAPDITVEALVPPIPDSVLGAVARFLAEGSS